MWKVMYGILSNMAKIRFPFWKEMKSISSYHIFVSHGFKVNFVSTRGAKARFSMDPIGISSDTIKRENF
jgi:hypothetical protein